MDFTRKTRHHIEIKPEYENLEVLYPHRIMLYRMPPTGEINIQEFEDLALERLKVLRIFEHAGSKGLRFMSDEYKDNINSELTREGLKGYIRLISGTVANSTAAKKELDLQARRRDYISHFILRLAYCRSADLKRWFTQREMEFFRFKFSHLSGNEIKHYLEVNNLDYCPLTEDQKNEVKDGLYKSTIGQSVDKIEMLDFYKVHFTEVLDLVKSRRCYLKGGYAYVNTNDFISIVSAKHQNEIEFGLQAAQKNLFDIENDERLSHLLKSLHLSYTGKDYTISKSSSVPIESLDQLSKKSFPLCMRMCHDHLRSQHHHKHGGRMQYGLYLKGIGVTLEDALRFWREEFTKKMEIDKFDKKYAYNIRHNYGKEGSMVNYTPYSCMKIITGGVGPSETHGCPFKHYDPATLKLKLSNYGLSAVHVQEVINYVQKGHFQIACTKYFEITHETKLEQGINHPNQYFELSQTVMGNRVPVKNNNGAPVAGGNRKSTTFKKTSDDLLRDVNDDDELWNIAETEENIMKESQTLLDNWDKNDENEDFDISQINNINEF